MKLILILVLSFTAAIPVSITETTKQYRDDYVYNAETDAFYKLHIESHRQGYARTLCIMEGADLMASPSSEDIQQALSMMRKYPDMEYAMIGTDGAKYESVEIKQTTVHLNSVENYDDDYESDSSVYNNVILKDGTVGSITNDMIYDDSYPFICIVKAKDVPYDSLCGVYGKRYDYFASVGSCYKIPLIALSWSEAYVECRSEGAHLVVLNSVAELRAVGDLIRASYETYHTQSFLYLAGISVKRPVDRRALTFVTIFNETLKQAGFDEWIAPPNSSSMNFCGAIHLSNMKYKAVECRRRHHFICEIEVRTNQVR